VLPRATRRAVLHIAADAFLIVFAAFFAGMILFAAMVIGGGNV
jgi:Flp pilus assembly protein protease CpaA